jgi:UTP--glucose-1-phosphate uridylyltransferase
VGDHLFVSETAGRCVEQLVAAAQAEACSVSAVQATREHMLPYFGAVRGKRAAGRQGLYEVETVLEKPAPTRAVFLQSADRSAETTRARHRHVYMVDLAAS